LNILVLFLCGFIALLALLIVNGVSRAPDLDFLIPGILGAVVIVWAYIVPAVRALFKGRTRDDNSQQH
jgi:hypothetical protein